MSVKNIHEAGFGNFDQHQMAQLKDNCRPRILIIADGILNFSEHSGFGLWRFLYAITVDSEVTNKPKLTLAHHSRKPLNIETKISIVDDHYEVICLPDLSKADPEVSIKHYDQIWLFGIKDDSYALEPREIDVLSKFMNSGGGMFAVGDHLNLGQGLCGLVPRIRHMREWANTPMGNEKEISDAVKRIDTVVNPGEKININIKPGEDEFQFDDQSDDVPQRIYPNYEVEPLTGTSGWQAKIHPLLRLPHAPRVRTSLGREVSKQFILDMDVLPDHAHESVCKAVTDESMLGNNRVFDLIYPENGTNFLEFQLSEHVPNKKVEAELVAVGDSAGRAILNSRWKPPVTPRMFGVISAYDGHEAKPYDGESQPPGRIVCDSSFHHFLNINLDGQGLANRDRQGLGIWSGGKPGDGTFTPSRSLRKIFAYYRNITSWLQPPNMQSCDLWWQLVSVRYHPSLIEELLTVPKLKKWRDFVGLGGEAAGLFNSIKGERPAQELVYGILQSDRSEKGLALMKLLHSLDLQQTHLESDDLAHGLLGGLLAQITMMLSDHDLKAAHEVLLRGHEEGVKKLTNGITRLLKLAVAEHCERNKRTAAQLKTVTDFLNC